MNFIKKGIMEKLYFDLSSPSAFTGIDNIWRCNKKISKEKIRKFLQGQETYTVNRQHRKKFQRKRYEVTNINDLWQIDLMDFQSISKENDGYKFILICIDVFSKYLWVEKLKNKTSSEVVRAFKLILKGNYCVNLESDSGKEFLGSPFKSFVKKEGINFFCNVDDSTHACVVERAIRTFKQRLYKYFYYKKTLRYVNVYKKICKSYNKTYHSVIGMAPEDVSDNNILEVYNNTRKRYKIPAMKKPKYRRGQFVRISNRKEIFAKGSKGENFSLEIFEISKVVKHAPVMYELKDLLNEPIIGKFYEPELQLVQFDPNQEYEINKILKKRIRRGIQEILVTWKGYPKKFSSWIEAKNIVKK